MYCKHCLYDLRYVSEPRCPECGKPFDPADRTTVYILPIQQPLDRAARVARFVSRALFLLVFLVGVMLLIIALHTTCTKDLSGGR
jgi:hypothetical protein